MGTANGSLSKAENMGTCSNTIRFVLSQVSLLSTAHICCSFTVMCSSSCPVKGERLKGDQGGEGCWFPSGEALLSRV